MESIIYDNHDLKSLPPKPDESWTRFVCLSDSHSVVKYKIPPGDVLLHAGDLSSWGEYKQLKPTIDWLGGLPHEVKIIIAGNHDLCLDLDWKVDEPGAQNPYVKAEDVDAARELVCGQSALDKGIHYLEYESKDIDLANGSKWKVYGSPGVPRYVLGAFQYTNPIEARFVCDNIPNDVEILLTHTPPYGILDRTRRGKHAGCPHLLERLKALKDCKLHIFGHIHEAHGALKTQRDGLPDAVSVNGAIMDRRGRCIVVDMKKLEAAE